MRTFILSEISRVQHQTLVKLSSSIICKEIFSESPMTSKYVKRFRENVVVYQSSVDTKEAHHSNDISTTKKDVSNLVGTGNFDQWIFFKYHEQGKNQHYHTMTCVPEHDGKQEGKGGDRVHRGVDFPVGIGTVGIYQVLQIIKREKNILEKVFGLSLIFFFVGELKQY